MKIKRLEFENINSLYGHWEIDFTAAATAGGGIFAIIGPTGSGKTSILDAICLALYKSTPRLKGKFREAISKGATSCYSRLTFEVKGKEYCAYFEVPSIKRRGNGKVELDDTAVRHEIYDNGTPLPDTGKGQETVKMIEKITGLKMENFCNTIMLAQGSFDSFLAASNKTDILEKITNTKIYERINEMMNKLKDDAEKDFDEINGKIQGQQEAVLSDEEEQDLQRKLDEKKAKTPQIQQQIDAMRNVVAIQNALEGIKEDIQDKKNRQGEQQKEKDKTDVQLEKAQNELEAENGRKDTLEPIWRNVEKIDIQLAEKREQERNLADKVEKAKQDLAKQEAQKKQKEEKQSALEEGNRENSAYLKKHAKDKDLEIKRGTWELMLNGYIDDEKELRDNQALLRKAEEKQQSIAKMIEEQTEKLQKGKDAKEKIEQNLKALKGKRDSYESKEQLQEQLNRAKFHQQEIDGIQKLEELRKTLEDGKVCPLCGATHHPFAIDIPQELRESRKKQIIDLEKKLADLETLEKDIQSKENDLIKVQGRINTEQEKLKSAQEKISDNRNNTANVRDAINTAKNSIAKRESDLEASLAEYDFAWPDKTQLPNDIQARIAAYQEKARAVELYNTQHTEVTNALLKINTDITNIQKLKEQDETSYAEYMRKVSTLQQERWDLFKDKDPSAARKQLEDNIKIFRGEVTRLQIEQKRLETEINGLNESIQGLTAKEQEEANQLTQAKKDLQTKYGTIDLSGKDSAQMLQEQINKLLTAQQEINTNIGILQERLDNSAKIKSEQAKYQQKLEELRKLKDDWDAIIRIAGRTQLQDYAQKITMRLLLQQANIEMEKLTKRYHLVLADKLENANAGKEKSDKLDINVIDHDMGDIERPASNLSGGERFIVSLALALGLCNLNAQNMSIDTLFLDEGFGTLDEKSCHTVMDALRTLQAHGKSIGIISHVKTVEEMLQGALIRVEKKGSGKSVISGPGVI